MKTIVIFVLVLLAFPKIAAKEILSFDSSMDVYKRSDSLLVLYQKSDDKRFKEEIVDYWLDSICQTHTYFLKTMNSNHLLDAPTPYQKKRILEILVENKEFEDIFSFLDGTPYKPYVYISNNWNDSIRTVIRGNYLELSKRDFMWKDNPYCDKYKRGSHWDCIEATRRKLMYERLLLNMNDDVMIDVLLERMERNLIEQDSLIRESDCRNFYLDAIYPNKDQILLDNMCGVKYRKKELYDKLFYLVIKYPMKYVFESEDSDDAGECTPFSYFVFDMFSKTLEGFPDLTGLQKGIKFDSIVERQRVYNLYDEKKLEEVLNWCKLHKKDYKFK
ncbi:MAG: hypothetical protein J5554_04910 [Paludibacteraceae bacterium]|nr:hypothetical protein [Paludibacteraceae bacterium]